MVVGQHALKRRKELSRDLQKLESILWNQFPNGDFSALSSAITELNDSQYVPQIHNSISDSNRWGYNASGLLFRYKSHPSKSKPHPIKSLELTLSVVAKGNTTVMDSLHDQLEELRFDIVVKGIFENKSLITTYHLDRHIEEAGDNPSLEPHPHYHFQFGGKRMIEEFGQEVDTGGIMFLNPPRIPHHPMELILGVDFLISNFFPDSWKNLTDNNGEYNNLVEKYQIRFLKSYVLNFASHWDKRVLNGEDSNLFPIKLHPQIK